MVPSDRFNCIQIIAKTVLLPALSMLSHSSEDKGRDKSASNGLGGQKSTNQGRGQGSGSGTGGMTSLQGLPSLTGEKPVGRKSRE